MLCCTVVACVALSGDCGWGIVCSVGAVGSWLGFWVNGCRCPRPCFGWCLPADAWVVLFPNLKRALNWGFTSSQARGGRVFGVDGLGVMFVGERVSGAFPVVFGFGVRYVCQVSMPRGIW